jgi:colicin import membrane protein
LKRDSDNAGDEQRSDRWVSIGLSVVLHGVLVALLVYGVWTYRSSQPPKPTLAIEATVVSSQAVKGAPLPEPPAPAPPPPPPPDQTVPKPEPPDTQGPPQPTPEELAQRAQAQKEQEEKAAAEAKRQEEARQAQEEADAQAEQKRQDEAKKADAQRKAQEQAKAAAEAKKKADERRLAEQKRLDEEKRKAQDAQDRAQSEADLKRSLAAEEKQASNARANNAAMASWQSQIALRIQRAWIQPPSARPGIQCEVAVTQVPGGTVTNAHVGTCNGDAAVRESIESAVYRASPLPPPPDQSLFQSQLLINFAPN